MVENPSFIAAFVAGILSFISPCVLPLIPGYLSYISGVTLDDMQGTGSAGAAVIATSRRRVLVASIFFILGFTVVFVSLGAAASAIGQYLMEPGTGRFRMLSRVAGAVVILFGLHTMGVLRIGWLYSEKRVQVDRKPRGLLGAFVVGLGYGPTTPASRARPRGPGTRHTSASRAGQRGAGRVGRRRSR